MPADSKQRYWRNVLLISSASLFLAWTLLQVNLFLSLTHKLNDSLFYFRGPLKDAGRVVVVAIDDSSLQKTGDWPWPRSVLARLIGKIKQGGPKIVGVDLLLDLPTRGKDAEHEDGALAEVLGIAPPCVLPIVIREGKTSGGDTLFKPLDMFLTAETSLGVTNVESDPVDKITREFKVIYPGRRPSFGLAVALGYLGYSVEDVRERGSSVEFGDTSIPVEGGSALINYTCAKIDTFSAGDVLEPFFDPAFFFKDKIVLVGRTDPASKDFVNTPVPSGRLFETLPMAGIELWKETIDTIVDRDFLRIPAPLFVFLIAFALTCLVSGITLYSNKAGAAASALAIGICGLFFYYLFFRKNIIFPAAYLAAAVIISYTVSFLHNFVVFQREKRKITAAFKSYISPHVLQNILSQKIDLSVGGKRKTLTMLFADIKGFTSFSDTHGPGEVMDFLKAFFAEMNQAVIGHNGIIDKLLGDGLLAFFGDFSDSDTHALDAVCAALEMQKRVCGLKEALGFDLMIRIGVHTGTVDVGNVGSSEHLDYTVIGRNVNAAQRLEANCEPGKILISEATYQMVKDRIDVTDMREIPLKGFADAFKVCTVKGPK